VPVLYRAFGCAENTRDGGVLQPTERLRAPQ